MIRGCPGALTLVEALDLTLIRYVSRASQRRPLRTTNSTGGALRAESDERSISSQRDILHPQRIVAAHRITKDFGAVLLALK